MTLRAADSMKPSPSRGVRAPPAPGALLRRAQHLLEVPGIAAEALRAEIVRHSAAG